MSIIDELGGKVENQGKTPGGKLSAAEWNKLVKAVDDAQGAANNAQVSANNAQTTANNAIAAAINAQTTANDVKAEAVKSISVNGGEPVKPDGTGRVNLTVAVSDGRKVGYQVIPQVK